MKLTAVLLPALIGLSMLCSAPAAADTGDTGGDAESNQVQTWNSEEGGCMTAVAPATLGLAVVGLAAVARRRQD